MDADKATETLNLSFLGGWQVDHPIRGVISYRGRKAAALLAYLAVEQQPHSRATILGLLWPNMSDVDARNNLRVVFARVKKSLPIINDIPFLLSSRHQLQINPESNLWVDAVVLQRLLSESKTHRHKRRASCAVCIMQLEEAAALYQGSFLAGFYLDDCAAFEEWVFVQRERLHLEMMEALHDLTVFHLENGRFSQAEIFARRQVTLDPLHESGHRQLMLALAEQEKRAAALSHFAYCRQVLLEELGVEPEAATLVIVEQIKNDQPLGISKPSSRVSSLPENVTPFIGRTAELAQLSQRLSSQEYRLISLIGPGGIGKTRLAVEAARKNQHYFEDGVYFVSLAAVTDIVRVPAALSEALDSNMQTGQTLTVQQLKNWLRPKNLLLVIDNIEQVMDVVDLLGDILRHAPAIVLLVTSRERLNLQAEDMFRLRGLPVPTTANLESASTYAAVRLFIDRTYRLNKRFKVSAQNIADIVEICHSVEGMPLGIELAATWMRDFTAVQIAEMLQTDISLLETSLRDIAPHHRSMQTVFDHSWQMLTNREQQILAQLSLFQGGFSIQAAREIIHASIIDLTRLRYKSLIRSAGNGRYDMHPLLRQFAAVHLADVPHSIMRQYTAYYLNWIVQQKPKLRGPQLRSTLQSIKADLDNIRQAWQWALGNAQAIIQVEHIQGLGRYYRLVGMFSEAYRAFVGLLRQIDNDINATSQRLRLALLLELAYISHRLGQLDEAVTFGQTAKEIATGFADSESIGRSLMLIGFAQTQMGDNLSALHQFESGLDYAQKGKHLALEGEILRHISHVWRDKDDQAQVEIYLKQALDIHRTLGYQEEEQIDLLYLGVNMIEQNDYLAGRTYLEQALKLAEDMEKAFEARLANAIGFVNARLGLLAQALVHHQRCRQICREIGDLIQESHALHNMCTVNRKLGELSTAEQDGLAALKLAQKAASNESEAYAWMHLGYTWLVMAHYATAANAFEQARAGWQSLEHTGLALEAAAGLSAALMYQAKTKRAQTVIEPVVETILTAELTAVDEPFEIVLNCYAVLAAAEDPRADLVLARGVALSEAYAAKILDSSIRKAFYNAPVILKMRSLNTFQV